MIAYRIVLKVKLVKPLYLSLHNKMMTTKCTLKAEIDESLSVAIEKYEIKPRRHPGVMRIKSTELPDRTRAAIQQVLCDQPLKALVEQGDALSRYLLARHPPAEDGDLRSKLSTIQQSIAVEHGIDTTILEGEDKDRFGKKFKSRAQSMLKKQVYSWKPIEYNLYKSMQYLVGRSAAEYAVLIKIFSELKTRLSNFAPRSIFDFGSGLGTASWASQSIWSDSIKEYFNVDSSGEMNDLASLILRDGNAEKDNPKGVFYRQFLPTSEKIRYDMVISAYSLLELPSAESRLETVLKLWNKSQGCLVLVELGTNAGFRVINEARDFILQVSTDPRKSSTPAHVFAPCPHDLPCPRFSSLKIPCNFEIPYFPLSFGKSKGKLQRERFSYVVLMKSARSEDDKQWPRLISPTIVRSKHAICRMCQPEGKLDEIIFTASKHGKNLYRCARSSEWGDLLPIKVTRLSNSED